MVQFDESTRPVYMNVKVGSVLPLICTAVGYAFAAFMPQVRLTEMMQRYPIHRVAKSQRAALGETLAAVRRDHCAFVHGGLVAGVTAAAAPVFNHNGSVAAAIGLIGRQEDLEDRIKSEVMPLLAGLSRDLSSQLGDVSAAL
ncbi:IclR family transcriptional regulator domain-containing protein [Roseivivax jejudonensis]|uniref:IclR family transcriptional regulator domain-containing protein n=1 Tax=Roseivivax jejudonensis TaxID=1529041 RepID=UPI0013564F2E|nr:IclR family transcriptional regulator C-terminal domain-containing protein [Roseivivax jejudonensis]